jgi:hypothetical protein
MTHHCVTARTNRQIYEEVFGFIPAPHSPKRLNFDLTNDLINGSEMHYINDTNLAKYSKK